MVTHSCLLQLCLLEWFRFLKSFLQELEVGGCRGIFKTGRETEDAALSFFGLHRSNIQKVVGVDVVDLQNKGILSRKQESSTSRFFSPRKAIPFQSDSSCFSLEDQGSRCHIKQTCGNLKQGCYRGGTTGLLLVPRVLASQNGIQLAAAALLIDLRGLFKAKKEKCILDA